MLIRTAASGGLQGWTAQHRDYGHYFIITANGM